LTGHFSVMISVAIAQPQPVTRVTVPVTLDHNRILVQLTVFLTGWGIKAGEGMGRQRFAFHVHHPAPC
jgi:hypothetical protein